MGVHHDGFDLWNSKYQPRWNAVATGPKRDVVGALKKAAAKARAAVRRQRAPGAQLSLVLHLAQERQNRSAGRGALRWRRSRLCRPLSRAAEGLSLQGGPLNDREAPDPWKLHYFKRIKDLVDNYQPDLLYTDGDIFFEEYGLALVANHYNTSAKVHGGRCEAVYTSKLASDCETGTCVLDLERGVAAGIPANPGRPTPASATGTTTGKPSTRPRSVSSTCWWISSAATET